MMGGQVSLASDCSLEGGVGEMKRQVTLQTSRVACTLKGGVAEKGKIGCARTMFSFLLLLRVPVLWTNRITLLWLQCIH